MRSKSTSIPSDFDEFSRSLTIVASRVSSIPAGMTAAFIYESAKDELRWGGISVKEHTGHIMQIGMMIHLDEKAFNEMSADMSFNEDHIKELYSEYRKRHG